MFQKFKDYINSVKMFIINNSDEIVLVIQFILTLIDFINAVKWF